MGGFSNRLTPLVPRALKRFQEGRPLDQTPEADKEQDDLARAVCTHLEWLKTFDPTPVMRAARTWPIETLIPQQASRALRWRENALALESHSEEQFRRLPFMVLANLFGNLGRLRQALEFLQSSPLTEGQNGPNVRDKARSFLNEGVDHHSLPAAVALLTAPRIKERLDLVDSARAALADESESTARARLVYEELAAKTKASVAAAEKAAEEQWVIGRGRAFNEARSTHRREAYRWACAAGGLAVFIVGLATWSICCGKGPPLPRESWLAAGNLSHFAPRVLLVSVASFLMLTSVRNFRASRHNELLNAHRWRALTTFARFRESGEGKVADAVLLQAAEAVFSVQPSGFGQDGAAAGNHVTELVAMLRGKSDD